MPTQSDSSRTDSARVATLPEISVTVTRTQEPLDRVPYAVGVLGKKDLQRGQPTIGMDEALSNIPGVVVANRYNFSLDQRISIRGAGSRSNFGVRGLKILLDGVPQTLPDVPPTPTCPPPSRRPPPLSWSISRIPRAASTPSSSRSAR